MRAILAEHPGPPQVLRRSSYPTPEPGPGQVLVDVGVAAITFVDTQMRAGTFPGCGLGLPGRAGQRRRRHRGRARRGADGAWLGAEVVTSTGGRGSYASRRPWRRRATCPRPRAWPCPTRWPSWPTGRTALALIQAAEVGRARPWPGPPPAEASAASWCSWRRAGAEVVALRGWRPQARPRCVAGRLGPVDYCAEGWEDRLGGAALRASTSRSTGWAETSAPPSSALVRPGGRYPPHGAASGRWASRWTTAGPSRSSR